MDVLVLVPVVKVVGAIVALYVTWWLVGDFVLDRIGIPFLDAGVARGAPTKEPIARAADRAAHRHAPSTAIRADCAHAPRSGYAALSRSTGMSRVVRAW